jgi:hypothetical protein
MLPSCNLKKKNKKNISFYDIVALNNFTFRLRFSLAGLILFFIHINHRLMITNIEL